MSDENEALVKRATMLGLGVGVLYSAMGLAWVLLSDATLAAHVSDAGWLTTLQSAKGLLYVVVTAVVLALIVRQGHLRLIRAEAKGNAHELQTQDLYARHPQPMWVFDRATLAILSVNSAAIASYGYSQSEFLALTLKDINPRHFQGKPEGLAGTPLTGYRDVGNVQHVKKSGEVIHVHVTVHPVQFGGRVATMAMAIDVTQEVLATRSLERQDEQYRQLHQSLAEVLWLAKLDGFKYVYVSPAFERVYGRPIQELEASPSLWVDVDFAGLLDVLDVAHVAVSSQWRSREPFRLALEVPRIDVLERQRQEFTLRVPIARDGGTVDRQDGQRGPVKHPHGLRVTCVQVLRLQFMCIALRFGPHQAQVALANDERENDLVREPIPAREFSDCAMAFRVVGAMGQSSEVSQDEALMRCLLSTDEPISAARQQLLKFWNRGRSSVASTLDEFSTERAVRVRRARAR